MPEMSGFEVLEQLKDDRETAGIPIIVYTSRTLSSSDHKRLGNSAAALMPKRDLNREKFMNELSRVLGKHFAGAAPDAAALAGMHDKAHHACFIANSVKTTVTVEGIE
jgi:CheY-like chemotaxis protein